MAQEVPEGQPQRPAAARLAVRRPADRDATPARLDTSGGGREPRRVSRRAWYLFGTGLIVLGVVLMIVFIGIAVTSGLRVFSDAVDVRVPGQSQVDLPPERGEDGLGPPRRLALVHHHRHRPVETCRSTPAAR